MTTKKKKRNILDILKIEIESVESDIGKKSASPDDRERRDLVCRSQGLQDAYDLVRDWLANKAALR